MLHEWFETQIRTQQDQIDRADQAYEARRRAYAAGPSAWDTYLRGIFDDGLGGHEPQPETELDEEAWEPAPSEGSSGPERSPRSDGDQPGETEARAQGGAGAERADSGIVDTPGGA